MKVCVLPTVGVAQNQTKEKSQRESTRALGGRFGGCESDKEQTKMWFACCNG